MTTPDIETLYDQAAKADEDVTATGKAYTEATRARGRAYLALKAAGQSGYAIGKRLKLSTSRVAQIIDKAEKARTAEAGA